jgi:tocopherol O-methyltransferase
MISSRTTIAPDAVASHYDELDEFYREVWGEHVHHGLWLRGNETRQRAVLQLLDVVAEQAVIGSGSRVVDIGCGYGAAARVLAERGAEVTGVTISPVQHRYAVEQGNGSGNPTFVLGDWLQNYLPSGAFDAAIAIESSEHMPDKRAFFAQAHRVLRPGGRLVICAWLAAEKPSRIAKKWLLEPICREGRMPHMGNVNDYRSLARAAGLQLLDYRDLTQQVARSWTVIMWRLLLKVITRPRYLRFLFSREAQNRVFALTVPRIWLAYRTGAMRYGLFTFEKAATR